MNLNEFKHWFDGFASAITDQPTKEQWQLVLDKFAQLKKAQFPFESVAIAPMSPCFPDSIPGPHIDVSKRF